MYLHMGQDFIVREQEIIGIFDIDTTSTGKRTREFLERAENEGAVVSMSNDIPKSFIVTDFPYETVYLSPISSAALAGRAKKPGLL
ncbi:MAG: DUF370 domain-containing protein [Subdoligranulum sp.]|nr:DUF370 domain-containing protein [Subdoligranulum sp.]MCI7541699.1 DUF370 domain-containing protein [Subdoligranulum sp.]MDD7264645.1 DUF370 domain-containing protein [Subdoligranulum sp.]MDY5922494.1 DUF370 domain-containing protein [Oscillospiraceae bacterium]